VSISIDPSVGRVLSNRASGWRVIGVAFLLSIATVRSRRYRPWPQPPHSSTGSIDPAATHCRMLSPGCVPVKDVHHLRTHLHFDRGSNSISWIRSSFRPPRSGAAGGSRFASLWVPRRLYQPLNGHAELVPGVSVLPRLVRRAQSSQSKARGADYPAGQAAETAEHSARENRNGRGAHLRLLQADTRSDILQPRPPLGTFQQLWLPCRLRRHPLPQHQRAAPPESRLTGGRDEFVLRDAY
jgi:hypothetical protein